MRSTNPVFSHIQEEQAKNVIIDTSNSATYKGIATKTILLILITLITGGSSLVLFEVMPTIVIGMLMFGGIIGFIAVLVGTRSSRFAMPMSILYAVTQGVIYGTLTILIDQLFPGVALTAILGTLFVFLTMMVLYYSGIVKASNTLVKIVMGSLIAIILTSLGTWIITLINPTFGTALAGNIGIAIGVSALFIVLGALMLVLDFAHADMVVESGAPKSAEWQVGLGFMVTLIWIYVQMLRLLIALASRND